MRRRLVITNEGARHPFRRRLPVQTAQLPRDEDKDLKLFVLSFTAFFVCFYTFLL